MTFVNPRRIFFEKADDVPNSHLPVLLFRSVLAPDAAGKANRFRQALRKNGWTGLWTDTIYDYVYFRSNAHEALGIAEAKVTIHSVVGAAAIFGSKRALSRRDRTESDGAYPPGQSHYNIKRERGAAAGRPWYGQGGPLLRLWSQTSN